MQELNNINDLMALLEKQDINLDHMKTIKLLMKKSDTLFDTIVNIYCYGYIMGKQAG